MLLQTYKLIQIMNELKKKRSRFKELIETYCPTLTTSTFFSQCKEKDEYALSIILEIIGYINDPTYFNNKEQMVLRTNSKLFPPRLHTMQRNGTRITITRILCFELNEHLELPEKSWWKNRLLAEWF